MKDIIIYVRPQVPVLIPKQIWIVETDYIHFRKRNIFSKIIYKIKFWFLIRKLKSQGYKWNF